MRELSRRRKRRVDLRYDHNAVVRWSLRYANCQSRQADLGCGFNPILGFLNVDRSPACHPDLLFDAETHPWPWETSSIREVLFVHSMEHMGANANIFLAMIRELYRVCAPLARERIIVPHPRHDDFINDPTHVRDNARAVHAI